MSETFRGATAGGSAVQETAGTIGDSFSNASNNNYVNFNQFMMQHNFLGNAATAAVSTSTSLPSPHSVHDVYANGSAPVGVPNGLVTKNVDGSGDDGSVMNMLGGYENYFEYPGTSSNGLKQFLIPSQNLFQFANGVSTAVGKNSSTTRSNNANANNYNNTTSQSFYDNFYTPFGSGSNSGINYFANPFATGFDFSASKLQVSAPEFVPRFNNLSLNEPQRSGIEQPITLVTKQQPPPNPHLTMNGTETTTPVIITKEKPTIVSHEKQEYAETTAANDQTDLGATKSVVAANVSRGTGATSKAAASAFRGADNFTPANEQPMGKHQTNGGGNGRASGRRAVDFHDREDRYDRYERTPKQQKQQRYDNHRSNKRRDDWNRNRDRINGFRVDEYDNGKESPLHSPEKKTTSPKKVYAENEKLSQREKLVRDIETRRLECLVCVEPIKAHHGVWTCHNCYHILHLQCIIKWASSSKSDDGWRCPACQNVVKEVPRDYYCFCGKLKNPPCSRQELAHSCGEVCCRIEGCTHACTLLCHPGPCPPCQANVKRTCGCGKTTKTMQCYLKDPIECDATCGKLLNCELHTCGNKCHEGKCAACTEKVEQICHCTKQDRQVLCTRESHEKHTYSCGKPCGKDLSCGNHKCKDCCHAGECRSCKMSPEVVTSCPCGKMPVLEGQRISCLDAISVCEGICGKTLRCGKPAHPHHCVSKCHLGNCPPCNKQTAVKCRCGHMDQMIKCRQLSTRADDARCKKRCTKKRSCGKHKCNQECCIDIDHICPLPCNYTLSCGKHRCDQPCHRGNCPPCYRSSFEELYCECGAEVIYPPVACGTKRPTCKRPCSRSHPCDHPPQHNCHSAATCPPCMMFTTKWCFGQHEQRKTIACSQDSFSCGLACNKPLPCGRHKCIKACHDGPCQTTGDVVCKQSCSTLRAACGHKCMVPCHEGECPETPCKEMVEVQCECGNRKQQRSCHELVREYSRIATAQLASSMAEMQRGNYMELSEILAPVKLNKTNKTLDCNDECRVLERNRRLAIGLQIRNPDTQQKLLTKYSDFIRNFAKRNPTLVKSIHETLTNLVKLAKESKQKSRSHSFPTMNREKRQLVHEMCEMFGVDSVSYDKEPNRNVVATAHKDRSWLPATSIMEVMAREAGQRRVPVPSNNAWGIKR